MGGGTGMPSREDGAVEEATSRRAFLASGAAVVLAACGWDGGSALHPVMAGAGRFNDWFSERLFSSTKPAPKSNERLRSKSFPNYHISDMTPELENPAERRPAGGVLGYTTLFPFDARIQHITPTAGTVRN